MKLRLHLRRGTDTREEPIQIEAISIWKAARAAEALVRERNQHLPVADREVLLAVTPLIS